MVGHWVDLWDRGGNLVNAGGDGGEAPDPDSVAAALQERKAFERLVSRLSTHFIELSAADIDQGINEALQAVGEFCQVDRAYLFLFKPDGAFANTHEWCADGIEPQIDMLQHLPAEAFPWWVVRIQNNKVIHVADVSNMPDWAQAERTILQQQSILSIVVVPAIFRGKMLGFLGFDSVREHKSWRDEDIALLRLLGEMLVNALERKRSEQEELLVREQSMDSVARLAGGIAHDFNNLLAVVLNYASLLERELDGSPHQQLASNLIKAAKEGAGLTRQLLIVGRCDVVQPVVLNPNDVLRRLADSARKTLREGIALDLKLSPKLASVRVGLPQFELAIANLVMNARDAMPDGGRLTISTSVEDLGSSESNATPGEHVVLSVSDTGCGMTPEVAERVFEPFFSTKGEVGRGLGLSTVRAIVQQAGGHMEIDSALKLGTWVRIYLPAVDEESAVEPESEFEVVPGHGKTVLVVEDSAPLRGLISTILEEQSYRVIVAGCPSRAIEACESHSGSIDLLLSDVIMPEMPGSRLAEVLEERFGLSRVVFMSGYDDHLLAAQGILPKGTMLLEKPFQEAELLSAIRRALS